VPSELKEVLVAPYDAHDLAPPDVFDPVIEAYKKDLDVGLIRENLKRSIEERITRMQDAVNTIHEVRRAREGRKDTVHMP
jgi:hypothetical protein